MTNELYSKAAVARRMKYTPEERSARAKLMADARWAKTTKKDRRKHSLKMHEAKKNLKNN